jgi:epoxyqueuosine reductase
LWNINGFKARIVSIQRLAEVKEDIEKLKRQGLLDKHLADEIYLQFDYDVTVSLPGVQSLLIIAIPQPVTRATFSWRSKVYTGDIPPTYIGKTDDARVKDTLTTIIGPDFKLVRVHLPVKTLAVKSGLAQYGKNNITHVPGFGSYHRLVAFATDRSWQEDSWSESKMMKICEGCNKCRENCPTHCIPTDRFLLHAENCLTWHNEREDDLVSWIKPEWHHMLIGCMRCQLVCPVNRDQLNRIVPGVAFSEEETTRFLQKPPWDTLSDETRRKLTEIGMDDSYEVLARNLEVLIKAQDLR